MPGGVSRSAKQRERGATRGDRRVEVAPPGWPRAKRDDPAPEPTGREAPPRRRGAARAVWGSLRTAACGYPPWLIDRGLQLGLRRDPGPGS